MITRAIALVLFIIAALWMFLSLVTAPPAHAEVSAQCWAHLAEIPASQRTTAAGDVRYHRERGQFSPCNEQEADEADSKASERKRDTGRVFDKPGYHCKWTITGRKCG